MTFLLSVLLIIGGIESAMHNGRYTLLDPKTHLDSLLLPYDLTKVALDRDHNGGHIKLLKLRATKTQEDALELNDVVFIK